MWGCQLLPGGISSPNRGRSPILIDGTLRVWPIPRPKKTFLSSPLLCQAFCFMGSVFTLSYMLGNEAA